MTPTRQRWRSRGGKSYWVIPAVYAGAAVAAGFILPRAEHALLPGLPSSVSVAAASGVYSSIAAGMIALTGIVFSLTFVMVQFSATAYSPRLVLWVASDPMLSHALGVFTATFLYALAALAWVDRGGSGRVPLLSAMVVIVLLGASVAVFIALVRRVALLRIDRMLRFTGDMGREVIEATYPLLQAAGGPAEVPELAAEPVTQVLPHEGRPRAVQAIDAATLVALARDADAIIELNVAIGDVVIEPTPLLRVMGGRRAIGGPQLLASIQLGEERTFDQDPKYAIRLLVDIAIKALSPAVNDPTTAVQALDQIGDLLCRLGRRDLDVGAVCDDEGTVRLLVPSPSWDDFLRLALDEIRAYGATSAQVMRRMRALIADLIPVVAAERRPALVHWQQRLSATVRRHFADREERFEASEEDRQGFGAPRRRAAG